MNEANSNFLLPTVSRVNGCISSAWLGFDGDSSPSRCSGQMRGTPSASTDLFTSESPNFSHCVLEYVFAPKKFTTQRFIGSRTKPAGLPLYPFTSAPKCISQ